jgi:hypothetical protein
MKVGDVWNGRVLTEDAGRRTYRAGKGATQNVSCWKVRCLSCGKTSQSTSQGVRDKACTCRGERRAEPRAALSKRLVSSWGFHAKRHNRDWSLTAVDLMGLIFLPCHYCGNSGGNCMRFDGRMVDYNGLDRVDNSRGYTIDNVVACCGTCNMAKRAMSYRGFLDWIERVYMFSVRSCSDAHP